MKIDELNHPLSTFELRRMRLFLQAASSAMPPDHADGSLTGVVSMPTMLMPSEWFSSLIGEHTFESSGEAEEIFGLTIRRFNEILTCLNQGRPDHPSNSLSDEAVGEWCRGYLEAARMDDAWIQDEYGSLRLFPFSVVAGEMDLAGQEGVESEVIEDANHHPESYRQSLPAQVVEIHEYWVENRRMGQQSPTPAVATKVGRNEPCPCGSGRKYKRCCGG